jgi:hypothetical protein
VSLRKESFSNDKQTIKEHVKQVNTQVVGHNALPLDDKSTAEKIPGAIIPGIPGINTRSNNPWNSWRKHQGNSGKISFNKDRRSSTGCKGNTPLQNSLKS